MSIQNFILTAAILTCILISSCGLASGDAQLAEDVLIRYFEELSSGDYPEAAELYGGSYDILVNYNPEVNPDDKTSLLQSACEINGFQCLSIRTADFSHSTADEYIFKVEFNQPDGSLFTRGPCCGEESTNPPQSIFEFRVTKSSSGEYLVMDLPVYVP